MHFKVTSGAASYTQAVQEAVNSIVDTQVRVNYPTGHTDTIETAVLRAVRTGVAQASGNMAVQGMEERDWDVILVSAHIGARYGDGGQNPGNHFGGKENLQQNWQNTEPSNVCRIHWLRKRRGAMRLELPT